MCLSRLVGADQHHGKSGNPKRSPFGPLLKRVSQVIFSIALLASELFLDALASLVMRFSVLK